MRSPRSELAPLIALLLLVPLVPLLAAAPAAVAQEAPPSTPQDVFGETIEVRVVNVEVVVTDRDGNRVIGLEPEDFRLFVDGEQVSIDYFSEIVGGEVMEPADGEAEPALPGIPAAAPGETVGTSYLLFIDDYWSIGPDRNELLRNLADDLDVLAPGDRMAVVAFDGKGVDMLTSWTDSTRTLRRALSDAQARPALGLHRLSELRNHDRALAGAETARLGDTVRDLPVEDRVFAQQVADQVERSVSAAVATLRGFAQPPGRKVMLLLSGGWPFSPAAYAVGSRQVIEVGDVPSGEELLGPVVDTANLVGYTVYTVDVPGLGGTTGADVEQGGRLEPSVIRDTGPRYPDLSPAVFLDREYNVEDTLQFVAEETGGEALINAEGVRALERVARDTRSYYWLGFTPERRRDDRRHDIRVEVSREGLQARARASYLDMSREAGRTMAVESALLFGDPAAQGNLTVELGEPKPTPRRTMEVPILVAIPVDLLSFVPDGEQWVARAEIRVAALDERDRQSDVPSVPLEFRFADQPEAGKAIPYRTSLKLRRVEQVVVVSVTDPLDGASLTTRVEVAP